MSSDPRNSPGGIEEQRDDDIPRPKRGKRKWTEAQDTCLREMCTPGSPYSTAMMAARIYTDFGRRVSRFAVWGRVMRLGLSLPLPADQARPERPLPHGRYRPRPNRVEPLPAYRSRTAILDDPGGPGVLLLNASDGDCRFPLDGEGMYLRVCGEPASPGISYCEACAKRAFNPAAKRPLEVDFVMRGKFFCEPRLLDET